MQFSGITSRNRRRTCAQLARETADKPTVMTHSVTRKKLVSGALAALTATTVATATFPASAAPPSAHSQGGTSSLNPVSTSTREIVAVNTDPSGTIEWAGYTWEVKNARSPVGPGPNCFSEENVKVDGTKLNMWIRNVDGVMCSSEVINVDPRVRGRGEYRIKVDPRTIRSMDPTSVFALFTWDNAAVNHHHREVDIEFTHWSSPKAKGKPDGQFAIAPHTPKLVKPFFLPRTNGRLLVASIKWERLRITFSVHPDGQPRKGTTWVYKAKRGKAFPSPGNALVDINLWQHGGRAPLNGLGSHVVVHDFKFTPLR